MTGPPVDRRWNYIASECRLHSWAFVCSIPAGVALVLLAERATARVAVAIYVVSMAALFGTSTAYHRLARTSTAKRRLRRLDHSMIYVLIACTYIILGWAVIVALPVLVASIPASGLTLMVTGGIAYTVGAVVVLRRRPDPRPGVFGFHEVWHACTVIGAASHFAMVCSSSPRGTTPVPRTAVAAVPA